MRHYELKLVDSSRKLADFLVDDVGNDPERFNEMMQLSMRDVYPISMRAARIVTLVSEKYPELVYPHISKIISELHILNTEGVLRSYLKIITELSYPFNDDQLGILTDMAFNWLTNPKEAIAIRYYSIEILLMVSKKYPEIGNELKSILNELLEDSSSGLKSKSIKVLNYLKKL